MNKFIPLSVPNLCGNELSYATDAIKNEWVSTVGSYVDSFEKNIASYTNVKRAVACQSGTAGLHLALQLLGVGAGDEVIVPTVTFIASVNPVMYVGANPVFMDCDDNLTMDLEKLEKFLSQNCSFIDERLINKKSGKNIKAIIVVHIFGNMLDMERLMVLCKKYNLRVIEDAAEALGTSITHGEYDGFHAGTIGDIGVFSFNGNKIITTGGGGMIVSRDEDITKQAKYLSTQAKDDPIYFVHNEIGYNYRMTNLQAAIGVAQLEQLETFIKIKKKNYELYSKRLKNIKGLMMLEFVKTIRPNFWFYSIVIDEDFGMSRDELLKELESRSVQTRPLWGLIHLQKPYLHMESFEIEKANYYSENLLNLPCSSNLTEQNVDYICDVLEELSLRR